MTDTDEVIINSRGDRSSKLSLIRILCHKKNYSVGGAAGGQNCCITKFV